jgi:hypothetical protein
MRSIIILIALFIESSFPCDLKKKDRVGVGYENHIYLARKEKDRVIYRGIATSRGEAVNEYFKLLKDRKCPEPLPKL